MKEKNVIIYEYIFSKFENELYKVEHPCTETGHMYTNDNSRLCHRFEDTDYLINVFNCNCKERTLKNNLNKVYNDYKNLYMLSLEPYDENKAMKAFEKEIKQKVESLRNDYYKACGELDGFNHAWANVIEDNTIKTPEDLYKRVMDEYRRYDTELNGLFFDFKVRMTKRDIMETYAELQNDINGDDVLRFENGKEADNLIPNTPEWDEIYEGNCRIFLEHFNEHKETDFRRYNGEEQVDFVW